VYRKVSVQSSFVSTTTRTRVHDENESRILEITLDETAVQTARILDAQTARASHLPTDVELQAKRAAEELWRTAFGLLEPFDVVVPDAGLLRTRFDGGVVRHRRDLPRALELARASATLHQRQRQRRGTVLIADRADVELALEIIQKLGARESPRISAILEKLEAAFGHSTFSTADAAGALGYARQAAARALKELEEDGLVEISTMGKGNRATTWQLPSASGPTLPVFGSSSASSQQALLGPGLQVTPSSSVPTRPSVVPNPIPHWAPPTTSTMVPQPGDATPTTVGAETASALVGDEVDLNHADSVLK
jgi:DNA-binding transcriptional ArsR family regulator